MPTYEYECTKCDNRFELFQSMVEDPLRECPKCSGPVKRLIGKGAGIIFKGSGFYANDYRTKDPKRETDTCPNATSDNPACKSCNAKPDNK